jgi:hypothetical protein
VPRVACGKVELEWILQVAGSRRRTGGKAGSESVGQSDPPQRVHVAAADNAKIAAALRASILLEERMEQSYMDNYGGRKNRKRLR